MKKNLMSILLLFGIIFLTLLVGCTRLESPERRIGRVMALLLSAPDAYITRQSVAGTDPKATEYQDYLKTVFSEEDFTTQLYGDLAQVRLVDLMYPALCMDADISVEVEDIQVQLDLEQSRIYSVEGRAILTLGESQETLPINGKVQTDENGCISSIDLNHSAGEISTRCLEWVNTH